MPISDFPRKLGLRARLVQESWVDWPDTVNDRVGNIQLSRVMGADVRLVDAGRTTLAERTIGASGSGSSRAGSRRCPTSVPRAAPRYPIPAAAGSPGSGTLERQTGWTSTGTLATTSGCRSTVTVCVPVVLM